MKKYVNIYNYYKNKILTNQLQSGDKMPSIRDSMNLFSISKTTAQNAYFALQADGFIISSPKSGYYVCYKSSNIVEEKDETPKTASIKYDLKSGDADKDSFDIKLWQRYIKNTLRKQERLLSYSEPQGEYELRAALSDYIKVKRNIMTSPDRIVIGAGIQSLLHILCSLFEKGQTVSFPDNSFSQGISQFEDYGYCVKTRYKDANIIYVCPSHMTNFGDVMPVKRRMELVEYSKEHNSIVIEDDFDNDFVYHSKPTPSLFALSDGDNVIYVGSFSNVLIPSIRISFMVLTEELTNKYKENIDKYAQTASKTEQIALSQYIRDGHIHSQIRKVRRLYTNKTKLLNEKINKLIPNAITHISENGLQIKLSHKFNKNTNVFIENNLKVKVEKLENGIINLVLVPSSISLDELDHIVYALKSALE